MGTWYDPELGRPIAAPLERCAELLGVDLVPQPATFAPMAPPLADPSTVEALTSRILGE